MCLCLSLFLFLYLFIHFLFLPFFVFISLLMTHCWMLLVRQHDFYNWLGQYATMPHKGSTFSSNETSKTTTIQQHSPKKNEKSRRDQYIQPHTNRKSQYNITQTGFVAKFLLLLPVLSRTNNRKIKAFFVLLLLFLLLHSFTLQAKAMKWTEMIITIHKLIKKNVFVLWHYPTIESVYYHEWVPLRMN